MPFLSIFSNLYLMVHLQKMTWYRFFIWMAIGFVIYFSYGIVKSVGYLTETEKNRLVLESPAATPGSSFDNENYFEEETEANKKSEKNFKSINSD